MGDLKSSDAPGDGSASDSSIHQGANACLEWAAGQATMVGEAECGDAYVVQAVKDGALVAVVDGLGHGAEAAHAARLACQTLVSQPLGSVETLVRACHLALMGTRGVVMTVVRLDAVTRTLAWLSVGNVEGVMVRASVHDPRQPERVVMRSGVVGYQLPHLQPSTTDVAPGDLLLLATDGVSLPAVHSLARYAQPAITARAVLDQRSGADDALVLVARYLGGSDEQNQGRVQ